MSRVDRLRFGTAVCTALICLLAAYSAEVSSKDQPAGQDGGPRIVFPPNRSVLLSGELDVICSAAEGVLEVDGEQYEWEPFEPPLRVARVMLYPGPNKLRIGSRELEVFLGDTAEKPGGPEGWPVCRNHPLSGHGPKRCAACHEIEQQSERTSLGDVKSYKACFECHPSVEFEAIHSHPLEPIEHCQMCHSLHSSTRKALLKAPVKQLCADCHDA